MSKKKRISNKKVNVAVYNNNIFIYKMENRFCVSDFIRRMRQAIRYIKRQGINFININCLCAKEHIFPDACLPISALIQEYKEIYNIEINVIIKNNIYLESCHFDNPLKLSSEEIKKLSNPLNKIFIYEPTDEQNGQAAALNQAFVDYISKTVECEDGVLAGLSWCMYEIMDNVLIHSKSYKGYVMAQYHKKSKRLAICVYDCGIGIYNSLLEGGNSPKSEIDAIQLAIQEGVSDGKGMGNGLYGLSQIVYVNGGSLAISTGEATIILKKGKSSEFKNNPVISEDKRSTMVDFQLDLSKKTDIKEALRSIGEFDDFDIRIDSMIQENSNWLIYKVSDNTNDFGTRQSGKSLRIDVLNIIRRTKSPIIIDFSDISIVSSSFIDEFIAQMFTELGAIKFNQIVSLKNMNDVLSHLCNRSIAMRLSKEWRFHNK